MIIEIRNIISERFARNPALLTRPQTLMLLQILRHVSSSEIIVDESQIQIVAETQNAFLGSTAS